MGGHVGWSQDLSAYVWQARRHCQLRMISRLEAPVFTAFGQHGAVAVHGGSWLALTAVYGQTTVGSWSSNAHGGRSY
jgi:hypothetical protein